MTEATEKTREELEAEIAALRAAAEEKPVTSTRERSPIKPQDHKPADEVFKHTFYGVEVEVQKRLLRDWRLQRMIGRTQKGDIDAAASILDFLIGAEKHEQIIEAIIEQDGWCDSDKIGELTKDLFEAVGAGN